MCRESELQGDHRIRRTESFSVSETIGCALSGTYDSDPAVTCAVEITNKPYALHFSDLVSLTLDFNSDQKQYENEDRHEHYPRTLNKAS